MRRPTVPECAQLFHSMLARAFYAGDFEGALQQMRANLAGLPYHLGSRDERGFKTTFYLSFELLNIKIGTEFKMATGALTPSCARETPSISWSSGTRGTLRRLLCRLTIADTPRPSLLTGDALFGLG